MGMNRRRIISFFFDWHIIIATSGAGLMLLASWIYAISLFSTIPDKIILHTNRYGEIDLLGSRGEVYGALALWSLFVLIDIYIAYILYIRKPTWARIFLYGLIPITITAYLFIRSLAILNM